MNNLCHGQSSATGLSIPLVNTIVFAGIDPSICIVLYRVTEQATGVHCSFNLES